MNGPVLVAIGLAMLVDVKVAGGVALLIGVFKLLAWRPSK